jgi:hypothetical protein
MVLRGGAHGDVLSLRKSLMLIACGHWSSICYAGLDVWWDEGIQPSTSWRAEIATQLAAAKCVVAVWTTDSVDHEQGAWVMEEATHGQARKILAPVRLDMVSPPLGFGETQYADLAAWSGGAEDPRFQHFLGVVQAIVRSEPIPVAPRPTHFEAPGIKLQGVTMQNVNIHVGKVTVSHGQVEMGLSRREPAAVATFSPSMLSNARDRRRFLWSRS